MEIKEIGIYKDGLIIGYELQKHELDKDGIYKITESKKVIF